MHSTYPVGPGPQGPSRGTVVGLRVLFTALAVLSVGLFAFGTLIRLACVTRKKADWALAAVTGVVCFAAMAYMPDEETQSQTIMDDLVMGVVLIQMAGIVWYYLWADIRHDQRRRAARRPGPHPAAPYGAPYSPQPATRDAGPGPAPHPGPYAQPPHYTPPTGAPDAWARPQTGPAPTGPRPAPGARQPGPARIEQVRAELDELSAYLRDSGGRRGDGKQEGTR